MELLDGTADPYATVRIMNLVIMLTEVVQTIFALQDGKKQTAIQVQYNIHIHVSSFVLCTSNDFIRNIKQESISAG